MEITETFYIRRYWLDVNTPQDVLDTLNYRTGTKKLSSHRTYYVDINYHGDSDKMLTMMELRYGEWIEDKQELSYTVTGDDGL